MTESVVNASPVIVLSRLDLLEMMDKLLPAYVLPLGVVREINAGPPNNAASTWLSGIDARRVVNVDSVNAAITGWDLGRGESEVLTWAYEHEGCEAVLDDFAARKCASSLGIPVRGTVGLLVAAKRRGLISKVAPILDNLPNAGFRVAPALLSEAKRLAGE